jgi:hypothetical protein
MATITSLAQAGGATKATYNWAAVPTLYSNVIDFAEALTAKGSALASSDVIEAIRYPAGSVIHYAGIQTIAVDDATTLTLDLGITGGDVDGYVDGYDQAAAAAGDYALMIEDPTEREVNLTADSIDVLFATLTGTLTVGKIRVYALITDVTGIPQVGLAQIGS